jgi:hypothetical protein
LYFIIASMDSGHPVKIGLRLALVAFLGVAALLSAGVTPPTGEANAFFLWRASTTIQNR